MYSKHLPIKQRASRLRSRPAPSTRPVVNSSWGVGSEIKELFHKIGINICSTCQDKANEWNRLGLAWCSGNRPALTIWLVHQATKRNVSIVDAAWSLAQHEPALAARIALRKARHPLTDMRQIAAGTIVDFAIDRVTAKTSALVVGRVLPAVVTVSPRDVELHRKTIASLLGAKCDPIYATCEPGTDTTGLEGAIVTVHAEKRGQWRNFIEALKIGIETESPYFVTTEDDVELCRNAIDLVSRLGWPDQSCGCLQLYSARPLSRYPRGERFCLEIKNALDLLGACALVFRRDAAQLLVNFAESHGWRGDTSGNIDNPAEKKAADTFVGEVLTLKKYTIWAHNPSLANHIGDKSTMGHDSNPSPNRKTLNFPGIDADLITLFGLK